MTLAGWLGIFDIARRTVWTSGLTRFIAVSLLSGYLWLGVCRAPRTMLGSRLGGTAVRCDPARAVPRLRLLDDLRARPDYLSRCVGAQRPLPTDILCTSRSASCFTRPAGLRRPRAIVPWLSGRQWGGLLNGLAIVIFFANTAYGMFGPRPPR